jgi:nucleoside-diphosphate-sugar epimerase
MSEPIAFILGSSGLVGRSSVTLFLEKNYKVYGFSKSNNKPLESNNYFHISMDLTSESKSFFELLNKKKPSAIVFAIGNHGIRETHENASELYQLNLSFATTLLQELNGATFQTSVVFCSSLMGYIPDRLFPSYAASKAGLNQLIQSYCLHIDSKTSVSGIVLGPISKNPKFWFEVTDKNVAKKIFNLIQKRANGLTFYPKYGRLIALLSLVNPFWIEQLVSNKRKKHGTV